MTSYYQKHEGNLAPGHLADSHDIIQIQQNTEDAISAVVQDLNGSEGCILGDSKDAFILTPAEITDGRYIDQINTVTPENEKYVSIRQTTYRQGIVITKTSVYSVIVKLRNKSKTTPITVTFDLQDENELLIKKSTAKVTVPPDTDGEEFEVIFDLDYYPTALNYESTEVVDKPEAINPLTNSEAPEEGIEQEVVEETNKPVANSAGATQIFLVVHALNKTQFDIYANDGDYVWNDEDPTFGILMNTQSKYGQYLQSNNGSGYSTPQTAGDLYFKEVYSNSPTYKCRPGAQALIGGKKVSLMDTHVVVAGGSSWGIVKSHVYMDEDGHLKTVNSEPYIGADPETDTPILEPHLRIADVITYPDDEEGPVIIQDDTNQKTRLRDHHERLRRLENVVNWTQDLAIPNRIKYTLTGEDWIEQENTVLYNTTSENGPAASNLDTLKKSGYTIAADAQGNYMVKASKAETVSIPITFRNKAAGTVETTKNKNMIRSAQTSSYINKIAKTNKARAQVFAAMKNVEIVL